MTGDGSRSTIDLDQKALRRAWRENFYERMPFILQLAEGVELGAEQFVGSVDGANDAVTSTGSSVMGVGAALTDRGGCAILDAPESEADAWGWFGLLAERLEAVGVSGVITALKEDSGPQWAQPGSLGLGWGLIAQFTPLLGTTPTQYRTGTLDLDPAVAERVSAICGEWAAAPASTTYFYEDFIFPTDPTHVVDRLARGAKRQRVAQAVWIDENKHEVRTVALETRARLYVTVGAPSTEWEVPVRSLGRLAMTLAPFVEHALIRRVIPRSLDWSQVEEHDPKPPGQTWRFDSNLEVQRRYVPDAYGAQILTDEHLRHAHDLSGWHVRPLENGRNFVAHRRASAWFASAVPSPDVLAQAREDFGELMLS